MEIERFYAILGNTIQTERNKLDMSQADLGGSLRPTMTRASIANIEAGKQRVLAHTLVQLSKILSLDLNDAKKFDGRDLPLKEDVERDIRLALEKELSPESTERLMKLIKAKTKTKRRPL
jgi:transcriptional regulator with XRE-family HTH domain